MVKEERTEPEGPESGKRGKGLHHYLSIIIRRVLSHGFQKCISICILRQECELPKKILPKTGEKLGRGKGGQDRADPDEPGWTWTW